MLVQLPPAVIGTQRLHRRASDRRQRQRYTHEYDCSCLILVNTDGKSTELKTEEKHVEVQLFSVTAPNRRLVALARFQSHFAVLVKLNFFSFFIAQQLPRCALYSKVNIQLLRL